MSTRRPSRAILLAAGLSTRLRPLTTRMPKAILPVWGKPALHHALDLLASWGVRRVLINLHHEPGQVLDAALAWRGPARLDFSFESDILGTGGALRAAAWFVKEQPFWMLNADVAADLDPGPILARFRRARRPLAALWVHPAAGPLTVEVRRGRVVDFASPRPGARGTATFCGLQLLAPRILDYIAPRPFSSIIDAYRAAMAAGEAIEAVPVPDCYWADIGTPATYLQAHAEILDRASRGASGARLYDPQADAARRRGARLRVDGFACAAPDARIGSRARLKDCILLPGARVAAGGRIEGSIIGPGASVVSCAEAVALAAPAVGDAALDAALRRLGWPRERTTAIALAPRGSDRAFTRLCAGARSAIFIRYGLERDENRLYAGHARLLRRAGIRVPRVLLDDPARRATVMEDLGHTTLGDIVARRGIAAALPLYEATIAAAAALHTRGRTAIQGAGRPLAPPFSPALYAWERGYFIEHFVTARLNLPAPLARGAAADLDEVASRLAASPAVLVHRDLQSTNILVRAGRPWLIDFQGMRLGPAAYDVASLLCDPYVSLDEDVQIRLLRAYDRRVGRSSAPLFWLAAIERLAQALGAFARLGAKAETRWFARHIPAALAMMTRALDHVHGLPHLRALVATAVPAFPPLPPAGEVGPPRAG